MAWFVPIVVWHGRTIEAEGLHEQPAGGLKMRSRGRRYPEKLAEIAYRRGGDNFSPFAVPQRDVHYDIKYSGKVISWCVFPHKPQ